MATVKATFCLDAATIRRIESASRQLNKTKSEILREAVKHYHARLDSLSASERLRMLKALDGFASQAAPRPRDEVDKELDEIREARRGWHRP